MHERSLHRSAALTFAALLAVGCGAAEDEKPAPREPTLRTFIGTLEGTDAVVAFVQDREDWVGYVCGGASTYMTLTRWYAGRVERLGDSERITGSEPDAGVSGTLAEHSVDGVLMGRDGLEHRFRAELADAQSDRLVGLFAVVDSGCRTGLVAMPSLAGSASTTQGVWCDGAGRFAQVTPIQPIEYGDRGLAVRITEDLRQLYLLPASPPLTDSFGP